MFEDFEVGVLGGEMGGNRFLWDLEGYRFRMVEDGCLCLAL